MGEVLGEVLDIVSILNGEFRMVQGQLQGLPYAVPVLYDAAIESESGRLVDKYSRLGSDTSVVGYPEGTTEVDFSEIIDH